MTIYSLDVLLFLFGTSLLFLGRKHLFLGRKAMTNLDSILKSRDITLPTKVRLVKAMVFPVVMYGCESKNIKKAECWRINAFELWCWRRLLRVPWTAKRSNQSILKKISPEYSLEGLDAGGEALIVLPPDAKNWLIWKDPDAGKDWRWEEKGMTEVEMVGWHHQLYGHEFEQAPGVGDGQGGLACCSPWGRGHDWATELNWCMYVYMYMCVYHIFIHLSIARLLGCFHAFAFINSAAMSTVVHISFHSDVFIFFSEYTPRSGIVGSYGSSIFI